MCVRGKVCDSSRGGLFDSHLASLWDIPEFRDANNTDSFSLSQISERTEVFSALCCAWGPREPSSCQPSPPFHCHYHPPAFVSPSSFTSTSSARAMLAVALLFLPDRVKHRLILVSAWLTRNKKPYVSSLWEVVS